MSPSWISKPVEHQDKLTGVVVPGSKQYGTPRTRRFWLWVCGISLLIAIGLGVGLGVGLTQGSGSESASPTPPPTGTNNTNSTSGTFWRPVAGESWQIVLQYSLNDTSLNVSVYDIDLFDNPESTIQELHSQNRKVLCYFSAGSYEDWRPDANEFKKSDYGKELDGWPGEYWLNTSSVNVRKIMSERLSLAASKGCDGVDPDNIDAFDNSNGLGLTEEDAINYLTFLAIGAHGLNMSIGLKNAASIVNQTIDMMQWEVNEQCVAKNECQLFQPFIQAGKPVFHIEYPDSAPSISSTVKKEFCGGDGTAGFSTLLKDMGLDNWVETC
jgi:hypothetical protein